MANVAVEGDGGRTNGVSAFVGSVKLVVVVAVVVVEVVAVDEVVSAGRGVPASDRGFGIATTAAAIFPPQTDRCGAPFSLLRNNLFPSRKVEFKPGTLLLRQR